MTRSGLPKWLKNWLEKFLPGNLIKIELTLAAICLLGLVIPVTEMTMISLNLLAIVYFLSAFINLPENDFFGQIMVKVLNITLAIQAIGVMFWLLQFEGHYEQLLVGTISGFIAAILLIVEAMAKSNFNRGSVIIRVVIWSTMTSLIFITL